MKIVKHTATVLELQINQPFHWLVVAIGGILFILIGCALALPFTSQVTLACERIDPTQVTCKLTATSLLEENSILIPNGQLKGIAVDGYEDGEDDTPYLITEHGIIPLSGMYSLGEERKREKVNQIDTFINDPEQVWLKIQHSNRWSTYLTVGVFFIAPGSLILIAALFTPLKTSYTFDRNTGRLELNYQTLVKRFRIETPFPEIKGATVIEEVDEDGKKSYRTRLIMHSGQEELLESSRSASTHYALAQAINQMLNTNP